MTDSIPELSRFDHIGAPVWSADHAATFYEQLGVPVVYDDVLEEYNIRAVFLDFDGIYLELLEPTGAGNVKTFLERCGPGFQHVAYRVQDVDETVATLREQGITFQTDEPIPGADDTRIIFIEEQHTAGLQTELVEQT